MDPNNISGKRILFAPLNWGLGHATRSASLIKNLSKKNAITIASDGAALAWLTEEFPELPTIELPELKMRYSKYFGAAGGIFFRLRHFFRSIKRDYLATKKIIKKEQFDLIISDNRYGVYSEGIESILITHQLNFNFTFSSLLDLPTQNLLEKFDAIWVPDDSNNSCSGSLGKRKNPIKTPIQYIGTLSRFSKRDEQIIDFKFTLIASGPEPFRTQMIDYFSENFSLLNESCCIVCGGNNNVKNRSGNVKFYTMLNSKSLEELIDRSDYVICRSGYSSIMDLLKKEQKAVLIPTPNQSEQKYLAEFHSINPLFQSVLNTGDLPKIMKGII